MEEQSATPPTAETPAPAPAVGAPDASVPAAPPPAPQQEQQPVAPAAAFDELEGQGEATGPASLSLLYDLRMPVTIELGRTRMPISEILAVGRGSVIQLERLAGEPIDVLVGDRKFAEGEVVVVDDHYGVRITRIARSLTEVGGGATA